MPYADFEKEVIDRLARIEENTITRAKQVDDHETRLRAIEDDHDNLTTSKVDHETRIRVMERWRWSIPGVAVMSTVVAALSAMRLFLH